MTEDAVEKETITERRGARPVVVFVGFLLLGAALALVLFGGNLFNAGDPGSDSESGVLDQVSEFTFSEPEVAKIPSEDRSTGILDVGDEAYDFTLNDFDGNQVSLADFRGQPVIVNFWATWCAPCRIEMPALQAAYEKHQDEKLVILALDQDEPVQVARDYFYDEMGLSFTPLLDEDSAVSTAYGSFNVLPSTYFVDPDGRIAAIHRGPLTPGQIEGYLAEMKVING